MRITLRQPDDWHLHLRDDALLGAVLPATAQTFARAIVMPNLKPPVTSVAAARAYRARIQQALPADNRFLPLMTCYLTDTLSSLELETGFAEGIFTAAKLYPAGATTNSDAGVTSLTRIYPALATLEKIGMPLLLHGETVDPEIDVFDREAVFIERSLIPLRRDFPALKIVFEHVTTEQAVDYVMQAKEPLAATITPHHLMLNRNAMFERGLRPHAYCLPVVKRERHRLALRRAAVSGNPRFFLGTDSAPHPRHLKEHECGCAGLFNAPSALACYAQVFAEENALPKFEDFAATFGPRFYGLPLNQRRIELSLANTPFDYPDWVTADGAIKVFAPESACRWRVRVLD